MLRPDSIRALAKCRAVAHDPRSESRMFDKERCLLSDGHTAYCTRTIALESVQCVRN
jgi:hypothetical protein